MYNIESILTLNTLYIAIVGFLTLLCGGLFGYLLAANRLNSQFTRQLMSEQQQYQELKESVISIESARHVLQDENDRLQDVLSRREAELETQRTQVNGLSTRVASLKATLAHQQQASAEKLALLQDARVQLSNEFELLANRIFEEKNDSFNKNNQQTLNLTLNPLKQQLADFRKKVEDVYDKDSKERVSLVSHINQLKALNQQMSVDAINLTNALKGDNKAQGNWGEVVLERVLEESGLRKGHEYDVQVSLKSESGQLRKPDVIVHLPENKDIIIDSKVSLRHYEQFCSSDMQEEQQVALAAHINSVREHIKGLSVKNYEKLEGIRTLDFVFIFIPIEPAFMAAFEHDPAMFKDAYEKNIIIVGPTTLLATLRTVQSIWRYERQNRNAEEIARQAGAMHDKFVGFVEDLNKVSAFIDKAADAQASALGKLSTGTGNLVSRTIKLEQLGAKVKKKIPVSMALHADDTDVVPNKCSEDPLELSTDERL